MADCTMSGVHILISTIAATLLWFASHYAGFHFDTCSAMETGI